MFHKSAVKGTWVTGDLGAALEGAVGDEDCGKEGDVGDTLKAEEQWNALEIGEKQEKGDALARACLKLEICWTPEVSKVLEKRR